MSSQILLNADQVMDLLMLEIERCGTQKDFGEAHNFSPNLISMFKHGVRRTPPPTLLRVLGLEKVVYYRRKND